MDERRRRSIKEGFDLGVGFFGFFTVAFVVITLITELTAKPALGWAITALVLALVTGAVWYGRKEVLRRIDESAAAIEDD